MSIQLPAIFGPKQQQRLEAIRTRLEEIDREDDEARDRKTERMVDADAKAVTALEAKIEALGSEKEALETEEKGLEALKDFSDGFEAKVRPILEIGSAVIEALPGPMAEVIATFSAASLQMWEQLDATHKRYRRLVAEQRMNAFKAYREAGFPIDQAFRLVEAEAQTASPLENLRENFKVNLKT